MSTVLLFDALAKASQERTLVGFLWEVLLLFIPLWVAMVLGVVAGWAWRPRWVAGLACESTDQRKAATPVPPPSTHQPLRNLGEVDLVKTRLVSCPSMLSKAKVERLIDVDYVPLGREHGVGGARLVVSTEDLEHLRQLVEGTDDGAPWLQMMDRSLPTVKLRAWRRDPDVSPPQFCTRTIFEDVTPEVMRDFFWDDEFRITSKWDDMLLHHEILEECHETGTMVVHWIRKFPFFCSDREYIIGRRIWRCGSSYYCVTKGVPWSSLPAQKKLRRVDLYYSSWYIRAVESAEGKLSACEVTFFHHEDMGIPWELVKLGARHGMWGTVKKIEPGLRAYQAARESGVAPSRYASLAQINDEATFNPVASAEENLLEIQGDATKDDHLGWGMHKLLILGGVLMLACTLERSFLTKAAVFGVAGRFPRPGR